MRFSSSLFSLFALGLILLSSPGQAFDVVPTVSVIELPGNESGITVTVRNPRRVDVAVAMEMFERFVNEDGSERQEPADESFMIFPPQAAVPAGGSQAIRIQWLNAAPQVSRSFSLYASEIQVDLEGIDKPTVQTIFRMGASVHVAAKGTSPKPVLAAATPLENGVSVTLANEGNRFFYINSLALDFGGNRIAGLELANIAGRTLVPPGARRTFNVADVTGTPTLDAEPSQ